MRPTFLAAFFIVVALLAPSIAAAVANLDTFPADATPTGQLANLDSDTDADMPTVTATRRTVNGRPIAWQPNPGPQTRFLSLACYEGLYGGAAGGGKSDALVAGALRYADRPEYQGILFRRTFPELKKTLIERSREIYPRAFPKARYNEQDHVWRFPSGARIYFGHLEHEKSKTTYQGAEFQYVGFDEVTHFTESQYAYMLSRARSSAGIPVRIRAATNPGGDGHEWVFKRWGPWLDPDSEVRAAPGQVLYYVNEAEGEATRERYVAKGTLDADGSPALGRVFVPAKLADNPILTSKDPAYRSRLAALDPVTRAQLRDGNWLIKPAAGLYFKRGWFKWLDVPPAEVVSRVRYWDLAASPTGDWAAGVRLAKTSSGLYVVEHVQRLRGTPGEVRAAVKATAELDGKDVPIDLEQDPGQAGKDQIASYIQMLDGWAVHGRPKRVDKITAAGPISSQAQSGNVALVRAAWNEAFVSEVEAFPESKHDDQVDGLSGAHASLTATPEAAEYEPLIIGGRWS